jgi:sugar phosphate isomerase/epimerase
LECDFVFDSQPQKYRSQGYQREQIVIYSSRRKFLKEIATVLAMSVASGTECLRANPLNMPIGFQAYDARRVLRDDYPGGWKLLASYGFQTVDLVSFVGYGYENSALSKMSASEIRGPMNDAGITAENCQFSFNELHEEYSEKLKLSRALGLKNIVCAPASERTKTADDWKWQAQQLNQLGKKLKQDGFLLGYHNHEIEFLPVSGKQIPYEILMAETDPQLVWFQIDVGNLTFAGANALDYLTRFSNRYFSMHAKDFAPGKMSVPVGQGVLDWKRIFEAAKKTPIRNYFAECSSYGATTLQGTPAAAFPADIMEQLRLSCLYLKKLEV